MRKRFSETHRFLALQACWTILRGGSVAYNLNITREGVESLQPPLFFADCQIEGKPLEPRHIWHVDADVQPE